MDNQYITLNVNEYGVTSKIHVNQNDSGRTLICQIADMQIPSGSTAIFGATKPSGLGIYNNATIDGNTVSVDLTDQTLAELGDLKAQIKITNNGKTVKTFRFLIVVEEDVTGDHLESENESTVFDEKLEQMQEQVNEAVGAAGTATTAANNAASAANNAADAANEAATNANSVAENIQQKANGGDFSASVEVGTVTTGDAGSQASVENTGTAKDVVFDFVIPRGNTGATPNITANASVDSNVGTPSVTVTKSGTAENPVFTFVFKNLKGETGDIENIDGVSVNFTQAAARANIASGETFAVLFGKIMKYFADLGAAAFQAVANNLTTTAAGSVLDAQQGKALSDSLLAAQSNLQGQIDTLEDDVESLNSNMHLVEIDYLSKNLKVTDDIIADALNMYFGESAFYSCSGGSYTGSFPNVNYKYGAGFAMKRNTNSIFVIVFPEDTGRPVIRNNYNGTTWSGWHDFAGNTL